KQRQCHRKDPGSCSPKKGDQKMKLWERIRQAAFPGKNRRRERIREQISLDVEEPLQANPESTRPATADAVDAPALKLDREIDFSRVDDLEAYTENLNVPEESIERWISAGLLYPDEIRTAERMIKIIRKKVGLSRAA
ncbi:MAG: hypothetical protein PVG78_14435, partial [Desulfobacterales bacterium]